MVQHGNDHLTGADRDHVFFSPADAARLGLAQDAPIRLAREHGTFDGRVFLADVAPRTLAGSLAGGEPVNPLIRAGVVDEEGGVPDYNALVRIERLPAGARRRARFWSLGSRRRAGATRAPISSGRRRFPRVSTDRAPRPPNGTSGGM